MPSFTYEPLDFRCSAFRLVRLQKGTAPEIECELIHTSLDENVIPYEAVSYTWGSSEKLHAITIQGRELGVTNNLWRVLRILRQPETDRYLWVDAISINQGSPTERGHQVQRMREIYSAADRVLFCLGGASTDSTEIFMASVVDLQKEVDGFRWHPSDARWKYAWRKVQQRMCVLYGNEYEQHQREGLEHILNRKWFRRVWILQEVAKARRAQLYYGASSVSAHVFVMSIQLIGVSLSRHTKAVVGLMPGLRPSPGIAYHGDLYSLLIQFSKSEASDQRDKIFALLGLRTDRRVLYPDYRLPVNVLIERLNRHLFGHESLDSYEGPSYGGHEFELPTELDASLKTPTSPRIKQDKEQSQSTGHIYYRGLQEEVMKRAPGGHDIGQYLSTLQHIHLKALSGDVEMAFNLLFEPRNHDIIISLLERQRNSIYITPAMFWIAAEFERSGKMVELLLQHGREIRIDAKDLIPEHPQELDRVKEIIKSLLNSKGKGVKIDTDLLHLRQLLLIVPQDEIKLAVEMANGKDLRTCRVIEKIIHILHSQPTTEFVRNEWISAFIYHGAGYDAELLHMLLAAIKLGATKIIKLLTRPIMDWQGTPQWLFAACLFADKTLDIERSKPSQPPPVIEVSQRNQAIAAILLETLAEKDNLQATNHWPSPTIMSEPIDVIIPDYGTLSFLLGESAGPKATDGFERPLPPLHHAAKRGYIWLVYSLLEANAEVSLSDYLGRTPVSYAAEGGHSSVVRLLLEVGADVYLSDNLGRSPIFYAAEEGHSSVVELLLEAGADTTARDGSERTALHCAADNGHLPVVQLLSEASANGRIPHSRRREAFEIRHSKGFLPRSRGPVRLPRDPGFLFSLPAINIWDERYYSLT
ncbi:hypothetical protein F5Y10DRAFT_286824 [Nemania abortiva]|nr:hypothetical protein F5Y10DRAFT_286824 [Nemania abortiva]